MPRNGVTAVINLALWFIELFCKRVVKSLELQLEATDALVSCELAAAGHLENQDANRNSGVWIRGRDVSG